MLSLNHDFLSVLNTKLFLRLLLASIVGLLFFQSVNASPVSANYQDEQGTICTNGASDSSSDSEVDTTATEYQPYESDRSIGEHVLALPSYLLHWSTRPLGWGVKYVEENFTHWFKGERAPYGIFPLFELGGEVIGEAGLLLYHNNIGANHHQARMEMTAGLDGYREVDVDYVLPNNNPSNASEMMRLELNYEDDPRESLFYDKPGDDHRTFYTFERLSADITYNFNFGDTHRWSFYGGYRNTDIGVSDESESDDFEFITFPTDSVGRTSLGSIGSSISFDLTRGAKRTIRGSRYIGEINFNRSLTSNDLKFLDYRFEWHQFVPVPLLPDDRRLALRSRLDKALLLDGDRLPFYELPDLGGAKNLRGVRSHRYRDDGALLFTLEYRYPIWSFADAVVFMDKGQVFNKYEDIELLDWQNSYGFGFHLLSGNNFAFRSEFAFSKDYSRIILSISPNF